MGRTIIILVIICTTFILPTEKAHAAETTGSGMEEGTLSIVEAQKSVTQKVKIDELIKYAVDNNPGIKAARLQWDSIIEKYPQATSLDDPMLTYTQPIEEIETRLGPQKRIFTLSQKFPFPGKLELKGEVVKKDIEIARTRYEKRMRDLVTGVKKSFYELYYVDWAIALAGENKAVLDYFFEVSKTNYGLDVSELDELVRAEKLAAQASLDLIVLESLRESIMAELNTLLNREPEYYIGRPEEPEFRLFSHTRDDLYNWAINNYEELKIAGLEEEKSELETRLSRFSYLPNFSLGLGYSEIGESPMPVANSGRDAVSLTVGITIPIWFEKNRAAVRQSEINIEKNFVEKNAVVNEIQNTIRKIYYNLTRAEQIVTLYGNSLIPEAKESLDFAEARYKTGEEMLGRLLETQSMWIHFRLVYYRAFADYLQNIAELERLTAQELDQ